MISLRIFRVCLFFILISPYFGFTQTKCKEADSLYKAKNYFQAIQLYTSIIKQNEDCVPEAYMNRGVSKCLMEDYRGGLSDFKFFLENIEDYKKKDPFVSFYEKLVYYAMGNAYIGLGNVNEGCLCYSKAGELGMVEAYEMIKKVCNP